MPDEEKHLRVSIETDRQKANETATTLRNHQRDVEETVRHYRQLAEEGRKLREIGTVAAAAGAGILAPLIASATEYVRRYKGLEGAANDFAKAQQRQADASAAFGRVAATALIPVMNQVANFQEKVAAFASQHPELVKAAAGAGMALVAGGGALVAAGTAISTIARSAELLKGALGSGGLASGIGQAVVGIGALAAGAKLGEAAVNELGKATGDERLEHFKLADALKTARQLIAGVALVLVKAFEDAKVTLGDLGGILSGIGKLVENGIADFVDQAVTGVKKFMIDFGTVLDGVKAGFTDMITKIRDGFIDIVNGIIGAINPILLKLGQGFLNPLAKPEAPQGGGVSFGATPAEQKAALDADYQKRKEARDLQNKIMGDALTANAADRRKTRDANVKAAADSFANFAETGSLGPALDGIVGKVKGFVGQITGLFSGGGLGVSTGGAAGISPEAVRAFIERNKAMANSDRQFKLDQQNLLYEYNKNEAKVKRDQAVELGKIDLETSRNERDAQAKFNFDREKALKDFRLNEAQIDAKARLDALQRQKEHNLRLSDLAAARDVAGFVQEMRSFSLQEDNQHKQEALEKQQRQQKFDQDQKDQAAQYAFDREQERIHAEDKRKDLKDQFAREDRERKLAYDEQVRALKYKHDLEKQEIDRAFAEQLASLSDNLAGLNDMQNKYFAEQSAATLKFVTQNKAYLQDLYAGAYGGANTGASGGSTSAGALSYSSYQGASTIDYLSSNADARNAFASRYLGSFASGLDYAPRDGWAWLHEGEGVKTKAENTGGGGDGITVNVGDVTIGSGVSKGDIQDAFRSLAQQIRDVVK